MRYMKVKLFTTIILILIAGIVLTSLPRVTAQKENRVSPEDQKLLQVAAKREGLEASHLADLDLLKCQFFRLSYRTRV